MSDDVSVSEREWPSYTIKTLAKRLGVSEATLYRMRSRRKAPPGYRIGGRVFYRESDVLRWLETQCREE